MLSGCTLLSGNVIKKLVKGIVNSDAYKSDRDQILQEWGVWLNDTHFSEDASNPSRHNYLLVRFFLFQMNVYKIYIQFDKIYMMSCD